MVWNSHLESSVAADVHFLTLRLKRVRHWCAGLTWVLYGKSWKSTNARGTVGFRAGSVREHAISVYEGAVGKVLEW